MQSAKQIFDNLIGIWSIKRVLGNYGTAEGIAKFTLHNQSKAVSIGGDINKNVAATSISSPSEDEHSSVIFYREDLRVTYDSASSLGQQLEDKVQNTAYQEYVYLYDSLRDKIIKKFTHGGLFYELVIDTEQQVAYGDHLCVKDFYKAFYTFKDPQHFSLSYYVKGPEKDYLIQTEFQKLIDSKS